MTTAPPYRQIDQLPSPEVLQNLVQRCLQLDHTATRESRMAGPAAVALRLSGCETQGPREAFIDDHEFCHIQEPPYGSLHLMLPREMAQMVEARGWGEPHALAKAGIFAPSLFLVYAPGTTEELDVVMTIVEASRDFARGDAWAAPDGSH